MDILPYRYNSNSAVILLEVPVEVWHFRWALCGTYSSYNMSTSLLSVSGHPHIDLSVCPSACR
jgi:hypothetical protein